MNLNVSVGCLPGASNAVQFPPDFGIPLDRPITEVKKKKEWLLFTVTIVCCHRA